MIHDDNDSIRINSLTHLLKGLLGKASGTPGLARGTRAANLRSALGAGCRPAHLRRCTIRARRPRTLPDDERRRVVLALHRSAIQRGAMANPCGLHRLLLRPARSTRLRRRAARTL
ncbi:hypothetical protein [Xanthomonas oryzae]|uniref:hypothetical protein n=1 Tax=Xanthomonas oryzae TaxID=347 RepID=UPI0012ADAAFD|nr:hypothetical protein [Xanthomonas oryzae]